MSIPRLLLLISVVIYEGRSFKLEDPKSDGVIFEPGGNDKIQAINMDENNPENIVFALITDAINDPVVNVEPSVDENLLGLDLRNDGSKWQIIANKSIDYESLKDTNKRFSVVVNCDNQITRINLKINNLDDTNPSIIASGICEMPEETVISVETSTCRYTISDDDGFLDKMSFKVEKINEDSEIDVSAIFEFKYAVTPGANVYTADFYLVLKEGVTLDYETITLYSLNLNVKDSGQNPTQPEKIQITVKVKDIPDRDPEWVDFFNIATIEENQNYIEKYTVRAQDGDHEINSPVYYKITSCTPEGYVEIDKATGKVIVHEIDRDLGPDYEQIRVELSAYDSVDEPSAVSGTLNFIVTDLDDNKPLITIDGADPEHPKTIDLTIDENYKETLQLDITVSDIDSAKNAMFSIGLQDMDDGDFTQAFQVIPTRGYQSSVVSIIVNQGANFLDYEDSHWRNFAFQLKSTGESDASMFDEITVNIHLNDLNDEKPKFDPEAYEAEVPENLGPGELIQAIKVTDADEGDVVTLSLMGSIANQILEIDSDNNIKTKNNAFDYEKQDEYYIQINAEDKGHNTATAQLHIKVTDVNDEDPTISVNTSSIIIEEEIDIGTQLGIIIQASDPDTNPDLEFEIDWENTQAVKNSQTVATVKCVGLTVSKQEGSDDLNAVLTIKENKPDFEKYDTLYLHLKVTDHNTVIGKTRNGTDSAIITIMITNINDNAPEFTPETLSTNRTVREMANEDTPLIAIVASDPDYDKLTYTMTIEDEEVKDWIILNPDTGALTIAPGVNISCDKPDERWYLDYAVTVSDGKFDAHAKISLFIIDQNTAEPKMAEITTEVTEGVDKNTFVCDLNASDNDRDAPYNVVGYKFNDDTPDDVRSTFKIVEDDTVQPPIYTIRVSKDVKWTRDKTFYTFKIDCTDNPPQLGYFQYTISVNININIKDRNDNTPKLTTQNIIGSENMAANDKFGTQLEATDDDSDGPYSQINFAIESTEKYLDSDCTQKDETFDKTLFAVSTDDSHTSKKAEVSVLEKMEGNYGCYLLKIKLNDYNDDGKPGNSEVYDLTVKVEKYNFKTPEIIFPKDGSRYLFDTDQVLNTDILQFDGSRFDKLTASDGQGDKYNLQFEVTDDAGDIFAIKQLDDVSKATLVLKSQAFEEHKVYTLTITASIPADESPDPSTKAESSTSIHMTVVFLKQDTDPIFDKNDLPIPSVKEGPEGNHLNFPIEQAHYDGALDGTVIPMFYLLHKAEQEIKDTFSVDPSSGTIGILKELDYETIRSYKFQIRASRVANPTNDDPADKSLLTVDVPVENLNDELPKFDKTAYFEAMLDSYPMGSTVFALQATDADGPDFPIKYSIKDNKIEGSTTELSKIPSPFNLDEQSGLLTNTFIVTSTMSGYFTFTAVVDDGENEPDNAAVKIYIVTAENRVEFRFANTKEEIVEGINDIEVILDDQYSESSYKSSVYSNQIQDSDESGYAKCPVYFMDTAQNVPVIAEDILKSLATIQIFNKLKTSFEEKHLYLASFKNENETPENLEEVLRAWLIGVSVVLGALCLLLLAAFLLKTRSLNQRINKLTSTKFGSQESGLNRTGIIAPTTNLRAFEANPVYNNNEIDIKELDRRLSHASGDSNLVGVEENPEFSYDSMNDSNKFDGQNGGYNFSNYDNNDLKSNEDLDDDDIIDDNAVDMGSV